MFWTCYRPIPFWKLHTTSCTNFRQGIIVSTHILQNKGSVDVYWFASLQCTFQWYAFVGMMMNCGQFLGQLNNHQLQLVGRAIAQAVSRRLPTAMARVRAQVKSCGICGGQSGTEAGFLRALRFPLPILLPPTAPHSSSIIRSWYNRPNNGRRTK
jgi:hypothetical protein